MLFNFGQICVVHQILKSTLPNQRKVNTKKKTLNKEDWVKTTMDLILHPRSYLKIWQKILKSFSMLYCLTLFRGLSKNLKLGTVRKIQLVKLKLSKEGWSALAEGIGSSKTLKQLSINLCTMNF